MRKAVFLDRDGVINENKENLADPEHLHIYPEVPSAVAMLNKVGFLVIVATNQPIIAKGFCSFGTMERIHRKMKRVLSLEGAKIDAIYLCPHHPERGFSGEVKELKIDCGCRKPKPGLLLQAIKEHNINPKESFMVGDSLSDVVAGRKVGCKTFLLKREKVSKTNQLEEQVNPPDFTVTNLKEAVFLIIGKL